LASRYHAIARTMLETVPEVVAADEREDKQVMILMRAQGDDTRLFASDRRFHDPVARGEADIAICRSTRRHLSDRVSANTVQNGVLGSGSVSPLHGSPGV
jgi:hypothetical protein